MTVPPLEQDPSSTDEAEDLPKHGRLILTTFGKPQVYTESTDRVRIPLSAIQLKHLAALTYIALSPGRTASRQIVAGHLWGDSKDKDPRHGLRASLNLLRGDKGLGPDAFTSGDKESITLLANITVDCELFERLVSGGHYSHAIALYQGKFFADWSVPGAEGFEDWANGKRQHYSSLFCAAASASAQHLLSTGMAAAAARIARHLRDESPSVPENWRLLLECRIAARDRVLAMADADQVEKLAREDEIELDAALRSLIRRARSGTPESVVSPDVGAHARLVPDMVGREREFNSLVQAWDRADAGRFVYARIESPAGLGKTRLLEEFAARLRALHARPATVVVLRGEIVHRNIEFSLAARLAHALGQTRGASAVSSTTASVLLGLEPSLADVYRSSAPLLPPVHDAVRMRASALAELAASVAAERRLAILIDDVHWADRQSCQLISSAFANTRGVPLLVVTSARTGQGLELPTEIEVDLPPLSADSIRELCRSIAALPGEAWVDGLVNGLHRGTDGSPFLVLQALALIVERGALRITEAGWECVDTGALRSLVDGSSVVASRIAGLSPAELLVLLVCALSAGSLGASALETLAREETGSDTALRELERRGLILRAGTTLRPSHDEIVAQAQRQAGADTCRMAHLLVANRLGAHATAEPEALREIGIHYHEGGQRDRVGAVLARFVVARRAGGDHRSASVLASEFLSDASQDELKALVRSLPVALRLPHLTRSLATATVAIVLLFFGGVALRATRDAPPTDFMWALLAGDDLRPAAAESVAIRPERFGTGTNIEVGRHPQIHFEPQLGFMEPALNPQYSRRWIATAAVADSGVTELFLIDNGHTRRLTYARGDDVSPSWSPDGAHVVFATSRWNPSGQTNIATIDPVTGVVERVTAAKDQEDQEDRTPVWSPDGSHIAFERYDRLRNQSSICRTTVDGLDTQCHALRGALGVAVFELGWLDADMLMARTIVDSGGTRELVTIGKTGDVSVAPAGWHASELTRAVGTDFTVLAAPDDSRSFGVAMQTRPERTANYHLTTAWKWPPGFLLGTNRASHPYLDSLFVFLPGAPVAGVPYQLSVRGVDNFGQAATPVTLRWTLLGDSSHAQLSPSGLLQATAPGAYRVRVSAGGWRVADTTVRVGVAHDSLVAVEDWTGNTWKRWRRFGEPLPLIDASGKLPTLNVNGEGTFFSGVYTPVPFEARNGFGIDVSLSTPITMGHGQLIILGLSAATDSVALERWDHVTGWPQLGGASYECVFHYPGGPDGSSKADFMEFARTGGSNRAPAILRTGQWFRVRLQILPDGRCVTALNGKVIGVSAIMSHATERRRIYFYGSTVDTKVRVGRLEIFRGVRKDIALDLPPRTQSVKPIPP